MKVLVVGGAGYIGSHMVKMLAQAGHEVCTYDNFSTGYRDAVLHGQLIEGDLQDTTLLARTMQVQGIEAVLHFAARIEVGESVRCPALYYENNVAGSLSLFRAMEQAKVDRLVFSSTAAVYGSPTVVPIPESHPCVPGNPYGASKWMVERMLADFDRASGLRSVALRYFNAAGADPDGALGERHDPETHLIPLVCQAASGRRGSIAVFGQDYDTADGTCVRDFIHVVDLCRAHLAALEYLQAGGASMAANLGTGEGYSVDRVIRTAKAVTGRDFPVEAGPRRAGDPATLVADPSLAMRTFGWSPTYSSIEQLIADAWRWEQQLCER